MSFLNSQLVPTVEASKTCDNLLVYICFTTILLSALVTYIGIEDVKYVPTKIPWNNMSVTWRETRPRIEDLLLQGV